MIRTPNATLVFAALLLAAIFWVSALSCAPASNSGVGGSSDEGIAVGKASPPFAMTLADGSPMTSAELDEADQPVHLFWFATW
jgi:cytochrome oxidase Cu insertion factor (SCO1/SenC/PrrC family)